MNNAIIVINGLTKKYGSYKAVDNLNLTLNKGEIFGLLGPNGAGKSTTILMLMGLTDPDSGQISVAGLDPVRQPVDVKRIVGYLPEDVGFYDNMTGLENLVYTAQLNGLLHNEAVFEAKAMLGKVGLSNEMDKKAGKYSRGMRQRLGLADVLIKKPQIIILDEPTLGIDPAGIREFLELIVKLSRDEGITVLFSSHHLHQVQQVCDRVGIFVKGKLLAEGRVEDLARQLFAANSFIIEAGINIAEASAKVGIESVINLLCQIDGVEQVYSDSSRLKIDSNRDVTSEVARTIVNAGAGLYYLNKKEYGLDDIYYKYFEGSE